MPTDQLSIAGAEQPRTQKRYIKRARRPGSPSRNVTTLNMTIEERAILDELARAEGISMAEALRRGMRLYAAEAGITAIPSGSGASRPSSGAKVVRAPA